MRYIVTGATGHVGRAVLRLLLETGECVVALVRSLDKFKSLGIDHPNLSIVVGDLSNSSSYQDSLIDYHPDILIHLAWSGITAQERNDPEEIIKNITISSNLLHVAKLAGCKRFVGIGSQAEYGHVSGKISEDMPCEPRSGYGVAKLAFMHISRAYCGLSGISWIWARIFSTYGPGDDSRHLIPYLIDSFSKEKAPELTECKQHWDYLFVIDAAKAIVELANFCQKDGIYNIGSGKAMPLRDIVESIRELTGAQCSPKYGACKYSKDQVMHLEADISKISLATNWKPETSMPSGISSTIFSGKS
jgi:nucleoside-diphosphate-sugar epimerase